jgi:hypothetical protein
MKIRPNRSGAQPQSGLNQLSGPDEPSAEGLPGATHLTVAQLEELKSHMHRDRELAGLLRRAVRERRQQGDGVSFVPDITGNPDAAIENSRYKRDLRRGLDQVEDVGFFARVTTRWSSSGTKDEPLTLLVSRANGVSGELHGDDWEIVYWTNPASVALLDSKSGKHVKVFNSQYRVLGSARLKQIEPKIERSTYRGEYGQVFVNDEDEVLGMLSLPTEAPAQQYRAATALTLKDIIEEADTPQRLAMHLPFHANILIEGPPGSGKTSIGLMRVACLQDQQWESLGKDRKKDRAFHTLETMRVLVFNDEMKPYLSSLVQSINLTGLSVSTTSEFLRQLCREGGTLSGQQARDKTSLALVKSQPEIMRAYWYGFASNVAKEWEEQGSELANGLTKLGSPAEGFERLLKEWVANVSTAGFAGPGSLSKPVNLAEAAEQWLRSRRERVSSLDDSAAARASRQAIETTAKSIRQIILPFVRACTERRRILNHMFETADFSEAMEAAKARKAPALMLDKGIKMWKRHAKGDSPSYSEADAALCAWLAMKTLLVSSKEKPAIVGGRRERLTHVVLDEAQDLSPAHIRVVEASLVERGTMTIVGDVRQNLSAAGGLGSWKDIESHFAERKSLGVNYRQSEELGGFLHRLHSLLFEETPAWKPSKGFHSQVPQAATASDWKELATKVADIVRQFRDEVPNATVGVLYDKQLDAARLKRLGARLGEALGDTLTPVHVVSRNTGGGQLQHTDCVLVASVLETKGLEFDAVIYIDASSRLGKPSAEIPLRTRNGLYVAASRARHSAAFVARVLPQCFATLEKEGLIRCEAGDP